MALMAYSEKLAQRLRDLFDGQPKVTERKMFGGLVFMVGGNMACGVHRDELMVRVGRESYADCLALPDARPMDFTGRPMRGFVIVAAAGFAADAGLSEWAARGLAYAASLPEK